MSQSNNTQKWGSVFAFIIIGAAFLVALLVFMFVLGNPANFENHDPNGHPIKDGIGSWFGTIYKGGIIVPILMTLLLCVLVFSVERAITIFMAGGKKNSSVFLSNIRGLLQNGNTDQALRECDAQKGSLANVVKSGVVKYREMDSDTKLDKDAKMAAIQKDIEEATALELPMLERNLVIISTIANISTLFALLGTVLGMIRAFKALAQAGAPDSLALATGISEALINTAFGIFTSALAIIAYNFFTSSIDKITYSIDEAGFSIAQTFNAKHNKG